MPRPSDVDAIHVKLCDDSRPAYLLLRKEGRNVAQLIRLFLQREAAALQQTTHPPAAAPLAPRRRPI